MLLRILPSGAEEYRFKDDVPVLKITEARLKCKNTEMEAKDRCNLHLSDFADAVKAGLPTVLQVSKGKDNERTLTASNIVAEQARDSYFTRVVRAVRKLESVYSYERNRVLIRKSRIDGEVQKVLLTSMHAWIIEISQYPVLGGHSVG